MIKYVLRQMKNRTSSVNKKWFAYPVVEETIELDQLSTHMANHNTPFSPGAIKGMLTDMIVCIKELLLEGKNVKLPDLAIFSLGIRNAEGGADSEEDFNAAKNIVGVRLRSRATGTLTPNSLNIDATLKRATTLATAEPAKKNDTTQSEA